MSMEAERPVPPPPAEPPPPPSDRTPVLARIAAVIAILAFGAGALLFGMDWTGGDSSPRVTAAAPQSTPAGAAPGLPNPPRMIEQGTPFSFADLVEHVSPAVVAILVSQEQVAERGFGNNIPDGVPDSLEEFLRQFQRRQPRVFRGQAIGSGFIIDASGYIVTNNHVVDGGSTITVKLSDGREFKAKLVGADAQTDVALLKVDGVSNLPTVAFGDDSRVRVGDWVVAVGNPFGLGGTVTAGIVSSIKREIGNGPYTDYIQIDAPINQGNSGGPTFDLSGRVIGMNSAIFSPSGGSVGIGFAIPASIVQDVVSQIRGSGSVTRGWLGVEIQSITPDMAASLGIDKNTKGAIVSRVVAGSPADRAGLKQGDVVLSINGREVDGSRDMTRRVALLKPGETAKFAIFRRGQRSEVSAVIAKRDDRQVAALPQNAPAEQGAARESTVPSLGLRMMTVDEATRQRFNLERDAMGVLVTGVDPSSEAAEKGFRPGDVIVSVGNREVRTPADVERGMRDAASAGRDSALFLVSTRQGQRFVALRVRQG
jgi:serine protease Do